MKARGVHLQYRFDTTGQRGAALHNPLFDLLSAVHEHGSIQRAAQAMGASYRHVWGALKQWEETLGEPLVTWTQGQPARLTPLAERLLWAETRARTRLVPHIEALRAELERVLAEALDGDQQVLSITASHDQALPLLRDLASADGLHIDLRFAGSVDALRALAEGRCLVAGFHVPPLDGDPDDPSGRLRQRAQPAGRGSARFRQVLKPLLKPGRHKLIGCLRRTQGLMLGPAVPVAAPPAGLADVARRGLRLVNRQPGSGTRLLMDHLLDEAGLQPADIAGWDAPPEDSHLAVAAALASGAGDVGPGIEAAARAFGLRFQPLVDEDYFLVCLKDVLDHPAVQRLRTLLHHPAWRDALATLPGYALPTPHAVPSDEVTADHAAGQVLALTQALPWWHFRAPKSGTSETG